MESIQEVKNSLLLENEKLRQEIHQLEASKLKKQIIRWRMSKKISENLKIRVKNMVLKNYQYWLWKDCTSTKFKTDLHT